MNETRPSADQAALELPELDARRPAAGRVEAAVRRAVQAAGLLAQDEGAAEAAANLGRGLDLAVGRGDPYAIAAVGKPLMEQLARLGLDPQARGDGSGGGPSDPWDALVQDLADELKVGGAGASRDSHPGS